MAGPAHHRAAARAYGLVVRLGVLTNVVLAAPAVFAPGLVLGLFGLPTGDVDLWARFAAFLLILLSLFYLPPAAEPYRSPAASWLTVLARAGGVAFFTGAVALGGASPRVLSLAGIDAVFAVAEGYALWKAYGGTVWPEQAT